MAIRQFGLAAPLAMLRYWMLLYMTLNALQQSCVVQAVAVGVDGPAAPPYDLDSIINQLLYPNPTYQLHASALRNQLRNMLRERQLATAAAQENGDDPNTMADDYDYLDEDKRSVAALAAQGMLNPKRSLATLAKNGQLPSLPDLDDDEPTVQNESKRYVGAVARGGGFATYGKRNIGTLARDYQLPQNGKRNLATLARLGLLTKGDGTKRNMAAVARYNSHGRQATIAPTEKRNIGALKASPVHGVQQKRDEDEVYLPASFFGNEMDYVDLMPNYWLYPSYADLDWGDFGRAQKRFLDTSRNPELFGIENALRPPAEPDFMPPIGGIDPGEEAASHEDFMEYESASAGGPYGPPQQKRHIGSVYRSGFLPSYRSLRSITGSYGGYGSGGGGGGRFSRSGRARQLVEYFPPHERLRQPIAAACKRCFLPYRPVLHWGGAAGIRAHPNFKSYASYTDADTTDTADASITTNSIVSNALPTSINRPPIAYASTTNNNNYYSSSNKNNKLLNSRYGNSKSAYRAHVRSAAGSSSVGGRAQQQQHWGTPPRITALHRRSFRRPATDSLENYAYQMRTKK